MADVVARTGHMDSSGNYVPDTVTVRVDDPGGWSVAANDATEEDAEARGMAAIAEAKTALQEQVQKQVAAGDLDPQEAQRILEDANV